VVSAYPLDSFYMSHKGAEANDRDHEFFLLLLNGEECKIATDGKKMGESQWRTTGFYP
jgi:hypothetical protein